MQLDPDEFTVKFNVLKPDNNFVMTTFTDGVIKLSDQITAVTGTGYYCILLMQDDEVIYSGNGKIIINDHVIGTENIDSVSEADGYTFPDDFYTKDTPLAVLDDTTTSTTSTWSSNKINGEINTASTSAIAQLNAMKTGFDGVEYDSPANQVIGSDMVIVNSLKHCGLDIVTDSWTTGKFIDKNGVLQTTTQNLKMGMIHVSKNSIVKAYVQGYLANIALIAYGSSAEALSGWNIAVLSSGNDPVWAEWKATSDCYVAVSSYYGTNSINPIIVVDERNILIENVNERIDGVSDYVGIVEEKDVSDIDNVGYVTPSGSTESNNSFRYSDPIAVSAGDTIAFFAQGYLTNVAMISTCDSSGANISPKVVCKNNNFELFHYTATENGYIIACTNTSSITNRTAKLYIANDYSNAVLRSDIDDNADQIEVIKTFIDAEPVEIPAWNINSYVNPSGTISPNNGFKRSNPIPVSSGKIVLLYAGGYRTNVAMISTCDQNGGNISVKAVSSGDDFAEYSYTTTEDTYIMVCTWKNDSNNTKLSFHGSKSNQALYEQIGDITNPLLQNQSVNNWISIFHKIGAIGDSMANGVANAANGTLTDNTYSWIQVIARWEGITGVNFTFGGATTRTMLSNIVNPSTFAENPCIGYIIALGVNDQYYEEEGLPEGVELGTTSDIHLEDRSLNADTFYGNYASIISRVKEVQPKAKIFVVTNPVEAADTSGYNDAIRYMATIFDNVYVIDLCGYGLDIFKKFKNSAGPFWYSAHSTAMGYVEVARYIMSYIDWIVKNNMMAFKDVQFIGTDYHY